LIKEQAHQTLVRPLVEYASTVWNPYAKTEINKIEAVQRRAARYVVNNQRNRSSVSNVLQRLKWRPLANRRKDAILRLMMMYKIDRELVSITNENRLILTCQPPFESLEHVADTRSVSLVVDDISSCSSLCGFNFVYFCFRIRIPNSTGIFNQRANKRLVGLFFNPD
jgi:hypothetical protein